jgi:circadian clock protein KaiB
MKRPIANPRAGAAALLDYIDATDDSSPYVFRLYVTGATPNTTRAIRNIRRLCDAQLAGRHRLEIVDVYVEPSRATEDQIVATPTLVKKQPLPERRLIGDLSNDQRVLAALDLAAS